MGYEDLERELDAIAGGRCKRVDTSDLLPPHAERKRIRVEAGVSGFAFARVMGVSHHCLYKWEKETNPGSRELAEKYRHALDYLAKKTGGQA